MSRLITSKTQLIDNIRRYNETPSDFADQMPFNRAWYAIEEGGRWLLAPSKFVGYEGLTSATYRQNAAENLDGRVTEGVLQQWAAPVEPGHPSYEAARAALNVLCAKQGKKPNALARISIVQSKAERRPVFEDDDLIQLLAAVHKRLSPAARSAFKRLTEA